MSNQIDLDREVESFFKDIEKQNQQDKRDTLKILLAKCIHLNTSKLMMDNSDVRSIISNAKIIYQNETFPMFLGDNRARLSESDQANVCVIQSAINYFNTKDCFNKLPVFDKREDKI